MSTNNKKSVASQALLDLDSIKNQIKEESKDTLKTLLSEAVKDFIRESAEDEDDDMEIVDDEKDNAKSENGEDKADGSKEKSTGDIKEDGEEPVDGEEEGEGEESVPAGPTEQPASNAQEAPAEGEGEDGEWSDFQQYQTGDNTYDLTGEEDYDQIVKVYKLMKDDDQIVVKKDGNTIQLQDNGTGAEYVLDLDDDEPSESEGEEQEIGLRESAEDPAGLLSDDDELEFDDEDGDDSLEFDDEDFEGVGMDEEPWDDSLEGLDDLDDFNTKNNEFEGKQSKKTMKENKKGNIVLEVNTDCGYTDNYQKNDPIKGLSANEPSKTGKSWEKGVPTGTSKPWAGETKGKGEPFNKTVAEEAEEPVEEATNVGGAVQQRSMSKSHIPANRKEFSPKPKHHVSTEGNYDEVVESLKKEISSLKESNKKIANENKQLKEAVVLSKKAVSESRVTVANLAKITKLFVENAVSQHEKAEIINRFSNEAKTIEQSKALYESIDKQLKKGVNKNINLSESSMTVNGSKNVNENKTYQSKDLLDTLDLIKRMSNC